MQDQYRTVEYTEVHYPGSLASIIISSSQQQQQQGPMAATGEQCMEVDDPHAPGFTPGAPHGGAPDAQYGASGGLASDLRGGGRSDGGLPSTSGPPQPLAMAILATPGFTMGGSSTPGFTMGGSSTPGFITASREAALGIA